MEIPGGVRVYSNGHNPDSKELLDRVPSHINDLEDRLMGIVENADGVVTIALMPEGGASIGQVLFDVIGAAREDLELNFLIVVSGGPESMAWVVEDITLPSKLAESKMNTTIELISFEEYDDLDNGDAIY